jgi:hypothetical protein
VAGGFVCCRRIKLRISIGYLALGAAYGAITSLINDVSSPYGTVGSRATDADLAWVLGAAEFASLLLGAAWAWAGLGVAAGWLVGTCARGAVAAVLTLLAATTAYYGLDAVLRGESLGLYAVELAVWWLASVLFGAASGAVGASIRQPGVIGLVAALAVPAGAIAQMLWMPPGWDLTVSPAAIAARVFVSTAAVVAICLIATRYRTAQRRQLDSAQT